MKAIFTSKDSQVKRIVSGFLLSLISICITLFVFETATRFLPPPYDADTGTFFACHSSLGWTGKPNFQGAIKDPTFEQEVTFNSLGMHDTEHALKKAPNTFRILLLGDSFIHAVQVGEPDTAHQILEASLNRQEQTNRHHFEVLSGGVINWGTNQQLVYYREQGRQFQPDLVLLAFYIGNDFSDNLPGNVLTAQGFNCYAPYFTLCNGNLNPAPATYAPGFSNPQFICSPGRQAMLNFMGTLYQYSRLYQQIEPLLIANQPRRQFGLSYPSAFSALYIPNNEAELEQAWQVTQATIAQLKQEVEADSAQLAVILISPDIIVRLGLLSPAEQEVFLRDNPTFIEAQVDRPNRRLGEFLDSQNISFIDLTTPMTEHLAANSEPLYLLGEGHWTAEGNRVAAGIMAQWLTQNGFLLERTK